MKYSVLIHGKYIQVEISKRAENEITHKRGPIIAVMHLIFGCMVAKRVWFRDEVPEETVTITDKLSVCFDVVRYANCSLSNIDGGAEPDRFPLQRDIKKFVPDKLFIDFVKNRFLGDFTFSQSSRVTREVLDEDGIVKMSY